MKCGNRLLFWALATAALLSGCGGGGGGGENLPSALSLSGTAANGLALASATVTAKCQGGSGSATTQADGSYQISVTNGSLPCMLEVVSPTGTLKLHSVAVGSGNAATSNLTPLTEMLTARVLGGPPEANFKGFDAAAAVKTITTTTVQAAQDDVALVLAGTVDTSAIGNFVTTPLSPATTASPNSGDAQDKLIDTLNTKLNQNQFAEVVTALATTSSTTMVKQMVTDRVQANQSKLTSTVDLANNTITLQWFDSFPSGTSYRIESQNSDGSFTLVESVPGVGGAGTAMQWQRAFSVPTVYRVVAVLPTSTVAIATPQGQSTVGASTTGDAPTIAIDQNEPVSGTAKLSVSSAKAYPKVFWYSDLRLIGTGTGDGNPINWNTAAEANGPHLILAKIEVATDSYAEVRRSIQVANSNLAVNAGVSGTTGTINVDASASSQYGIAKVEAVFDDKPWGSLTAPNACSSRMGCGTTNNVFRFSVDAVTAGSGNHTMVITATDGAGGSKSATVQVPISNLPTLTLTSPVDGAFVTGTLNISGTTSTDKAGDVTVVASLGDYQFLNTTNSSFTGSMSLAGLNPGSYTLTVRATDSTNAVTVIQRTITVASSSSLAYTPSFSLGTGGQLMATDGSNPAMLLYKASDGSYRMRNTSANTEVTLQNTSEVPFLYNWVLDNGKAFVDGGYLGLTSAGYTDCPVSCVYQWSADGVRSNLTTNNPYKKTYEQHPAAHGGYVIWANTSGSNPGSYTLYDVNQGTYTKIAQPNDANYIGNWNFDFVVQNGVISFAYWAQTGGSGTSSTFDVFQWSSATKASTKLSSGTARNIYPQTDGQTVAWLQSPSGSTSSSTILSMPVAGGTVTTVSSTANENFQLRDGVLAWTETISTIKALKAQVNGTTHTISNLTSSVLYGAGGGFVVYGESGKTYSWNASTKTSKLIIDAAPNRVMLTGSTLYFVMGGSQTVYKLVLN